MTKGASASPFEMVHKKVHFGGRVDNESVLLRRPQRHLPEERGTNVPPEHAKAKSNSRQRKYYDLPPVTATETASSPLLCVHRISEQQLTPKAFDEVILKT